MNTTLPNVDALAEDLDKLYTESVLEYSRAIEEEQDEDAFKLPDAILIIDLNSREPIAAFIAPSHGFPSCTFLPVFQEMSKAQQAHLMDSKYGLESGKSNQFSREWTKELLSHCQQLLLRELGKPLEKMNLQVSLTSRSDASERDKFLLLQAAQDAGCKAPQLQLIPTIKAVAVAAFMSHGGLDRDTNTETHQEETWRLDDNVLVICNNGDVIDIQSYSISWAARAEKSTEPRLKLEEIVSGNTVDSRRLAERQFTKWLEGVFGKSFLSGANDLEPNGKLMSAFAEALRNYKPKKCAHYEFPLNIPRPPHDAPYDPILRRCLVPDNKMREFCEPAIDSLLEGLDDHYTRINIRKKTIDKILFAEPKDFSPYLEDHVMDWGLGIGILSNHRDVFVGYMRQELDQRTIAEVALSSTYQNMDQIRKSPAHYGFKVNRTFRSGTDPQWTFYTEPFDNKDYCSDTVVWQLGKDEPLESHFTLSSEVLSCFTAETSSYERRLALYKCRLIDAPRHLHIRQNGPDSDVELVGHVLVKFTTRDVDRGEYKQCNDGVFRRQLRYQTYLELFRTHGLIKAIAKSLDQRVLGKASFQIADVP